MPVAAFIKIVYIQIPNYDQVIAFLFIQQQFQRRAWILQIKTVEGANTSNSEIWDR